MKNKYNWKEVQVFCDKKPRTWKEVENKFQMPTRTLGNSIERGKITFESKYKYGKDKKYNWAEIQNYCSQTPRTWKEVRKKFNVSFEAISKAINRKELIFNSKYKDSQHHGALKQYDWRRIQKDIDRNGLTWKEITSKYGCSFPSILKAKKRGDLKTLSKSQAMIIANRKHPRKHSQKTKDKISKIRKAYLKKHPEQVPYVLNHYSKGDSYPEKYFKRLFRRENILLKRDLNVGTYWLDFASLNKRVDIEIDGNQHKDDPRIVRHDKKRTKWLINNGWKVFRILWSDYKKKTMQEKKKVIAKIRKLVS